MKKVSKPVIYIIAALSIALVVMYLWRSSLTEPVLTDYQPEFNQCEKVYVGKIPYVCNPGELIYIDAEVAEEFCTDEVFVKTEDHIYCVYNGVRPDRTRTIKKFNTRTTKK
jgi:hypothetical protein